VIQSILIICSLVIIITAFISIMLKDLLSCIISYSVMSLVLTVAYFMLDAPDVAIAEAGIGACLTTVIFVIAIKMTRRREE